MYNLQRGNDENDERRGRKNRFLSPPLSASVLNNGGRIFRLKQRRAFGWNQSGGDRSDPTAASHSRGFNPRAGASQTILADVSAGGKAVLNDKAQGAESSRGWWRSVSTGPPSAVVQMRCATGLFVFQARARTRGLLKRRETQPAVTAAPKNSSRTNLLAPGGPINLGEGPGHAHASRTQPRLLAAPELGGPRNLGGRAQCSKFPHKLQSRGLHPSPQNHQNRQQPGRHASHGSDQEPPRPPQGGEPLPERLLQLPASTWLCFTRFRRASRRATTRTPAGH